MKKLLTLLLLSACSGTTTTGGDAGQAADAAVALDAGAAEDAGSGPVDAGATSRTQLGSQEEFTDLQGTMGEVKYLAQVDGVTPETPLLEPCLFQDTLQFPYHIQFLRTFPGREDMSNTQYIAMVLRPSSRVWWGGGMLRRVGQPHPISMAGEVILYTIYADNAGGAGLVEADIREVDARLKSCMPYAVNLLAFAPSDNAQTALAGQVQAALAQDGIAVVVQ